MRPVLILTIILLLCAETVGEVGQNEEPELVNSPIISIENSDNIMANNEFEIIVLLNQSSNENATEVEWITQICINSGVCYPPQSNILVQSEEDEQIVWKGTILIDNDASYVNWKLEFTWENSTETSFPEQGFGWKVWSTCWYDAGTDTWGGFDYPCEDENIIPGFAIHATIFSAVIGAIFHSKKIDR